MSPPWLDAVKPLRVPVEYRDIEQRGLILRVEVSGRKTWVARYTFEGRGRRYTLGTYPEVPLKKAREKAMKALGAAAGGHDPQVEREKLLIGDEVEAVVKSWLADTKLGPASRWKGGVDGGTARSFLPHVRAFRRDFGARKLVALTAKDVEGFVSQPQAAATRNRRLTALRLFFAWAMRKRLVAADPTAALGKERETERSRVLTDAELVALIRGYDGTRYGPAVRLLALTGLRRDEVLGSRWEWLDTEAKVLTIPPEAEKTGRARGEPRRVALSDQAVALLVAQRKRQLADGSRSGFIFATKTGERPHPDALKPTLNRLRGLRANGQPAKPKKGAKEPPPPALPRDATLHDVRRTVADRLLNTLHAQPWVVDHVVLGHVRPRILRTYMPTLPLDDARETLGRWAQALDGAMKSTNAPAVALPQIEW